ncbi:MAG TPA: phosphoserine phosphatase SerB [Xanthobacteraceae bacterium]|nr:phosphoserine phosphatase SerB [Xanthobacteraceae bacterium]
MSHVATLVSNPKNPAVDAAAVAKARALLPNAISESMLKPGIAADIFFAPGPDAQERALGDLVRAALAPAPIDVIVQETAYRRKKLFVADMDSTMIDQECIDELADYAGLKAHVAAITERAMRGELPFEPALLERVALLKGLPLSVINETIEKKITLAAGGEELIATLKANGVYTCLVSGGFTLFTQVIAHRLGFNENRANELLVDGEKLAGTVREPILGRAAKLSTLEELTAKLGILPQETMAIGDGANDLDMITAAGLGIAIHAKPAVAAAAAARIDHSDLSAIIYSGGYAN